MGAPSPAVPRSAWWRRGHGATGPRGAVSRRPVSRLGGPHGSRPPPEASALPALRRVGAPGVLPAGTSPASTRGPNAVPAAAYETTFPARHVLAGAAGTGPERRRAGPRPLAGEERALVAFPPGPGLPLATGPAGGPGRGFPGRRARPSARAQDVWGRLRAGPARGARVHARPRRCSRRTRTPLAHAKRREPAADDQRPLRAPPADAPRPARDVVGNFSSTLLVRHRRASAPAFRPAAGGRAVAVGRCWRAWRSTRPVSGVRRPGRAANRARRPRRQRRDARRGSRRPAATSVPVDPGPAQGRRAGGGGLGKSPAVQTPHVVARPPGVRGRRRPWVPEHGDAVEELFEPGLLERAVSGRTCGLLTRLAEDEAGQRGQRRRAAFPGPACARAPRSPAPGPRQPPETAAGPGRPFVCPPRDRMEGAAGPEALGAGAGDRGPFGVMDPLLRAGRHGRCRPLRLVARVPARANRARGTVPGPCVPRHGPAAHTVRGTLARVAALIPAQKITRRTNIEATIEPRPAPRGDPRRSGARDHLRRPRPFLGLAAEVVHQHLRKRPRAASRRAAGEAGPGPGRSPDHAQRPTSAGGRISLSATTRARSGVPGQRPLGGPGFATWHGYRLARRGAGNAALHASAGRPWPPRSSTRFGPRWRLDGDRELAGPWPSPCHLRLLSMSRPWGAGWWGPGLARALPVRCAVRQPPDEQRPNAGAWPAPAGACCRNPPGGSWRAPARQHGDVRGSLRVGRWRAGAPRGRPRRPVRHVAPRTAAAGFEGARVRPAGSRGLLGSERRRLAAAGAGWSQAAFQPARVEGHCCPAWRPPSEGSLAAWRRPAPARGPASVWDGPAR